MPNPSIDRVMRDGFHRSSDYAYGNGSGSAGGGGKERERYESSSSRPASGTTGKRGSRACVACRKGKNRCESDPGGATSCRRCLLNRITCVFEKAERRESRTRDTESWSGEAEARVNTLEQSVQALATGQHQIQNALQRLITMLPAATPGSVPFMSSDSNSLTPMANLFQKSSTTPPSVFSMTSPANQSHAGQAYGARDDPRSPQNIASGRTSGPKPAQDKAWPKLPGFAPPVSMEVIMLIAGPSLRDVWDHSAGIGAGLAEPLAAIIALALRPLSIFGCGRASRRAHPGASDPRERG